MSSQNSKQFVKGIIVGDASDKTKQLEISSSASATTATKMIVQATQTADRTLTLPDATDTLVGKATTDTLTSNPIDRDWETRGYF